MRVCGSVARLSRSPAVSRDLPMPASPDSNTTCPSPVFVLDQRRSSNSDSSSRPTRAVRPLACIASKRPSAELVSNASAVRFGHAWQAARKVRVLATDGSLLRLPRADELTDDHNPGCNSDTGLQGSRRLERGNRYDQIEPGPHSPLRVIFMCPRIAKMHQDAVPHVSRHEPVVPLHGLGHAFLIGGDDLA